MQIDDLIKRLQIERDAAIRAHGTSENCHVAIRNYIGPVSKITGYKTPDWQELFVFESKNPRIGTRARSYVPHCSFEL